MSEDWDNLIILDACRYDLFKSVSNLEGDLQSKRSKGSATQEFVRNNFTGNEFYDTCYINSNPYVSIHASKSFYKLVNVWKNGWNDDIGTVLPQTMVDFALEEYQKNKDKRLVVHFMQPHHPFLGPTAEDKFSAFNGNVGSRKSALGESANSTESLHVWEALQNNSISIETVSKAYRESLEEVLPHVRKLADEIEGKTVVTSDHGNLLGEKPHRINFPEKPRYGHPDFSTAQPLVKVPWLEMPFKTRRKIKRDRPEHASVSNQGGSDDNNSVNQRLEALGYKE
ncbi:sulfatase-like hydrolase/transferase [Haladaptatus litoreus]|nr:sulfatase-like hydrolase/transferase [Haladaptatus litoreus]